MRYVFIVAVLLAAACTVPPMTPPAESRAEAEQKIPESPVIKVTAPRELPPQKSRVKNSPCAGIDTGDPVQDTREKLNCIDLHIGNHG